MGLLNSNLDNTITNAAVSSSIDKASSGKSPTVTQYRQMCEFFDLTFQFETLLDSMNEIFRITFFLDWLLFFVAILFFFKGDFSIWNGGALFLCHIARAVFGFLIGRVVPTSYKFVKELEFKGDKQLEYQLVRAEMVTRVKKLIMVYYDDFEKLARWYTRLSIVCLVLDGITFWFEYGYLWLIQTGTDLLNIFDSDEFADLLLTVGNWNVGRIFVIMLWTSRDIVYILWIIHFRSQLGEAEKVYVLKALLGYGNPMRTAWNIPIKGSKGKAPELVK